MRGGLACSVSVNIVVKYIGKVCKYHDCLGKFHLCYLNVLLAQSGPFSDVFVFIISEQIRSHLHQAVRFTRPRVT